MAQIDELFPQIEQAVEAGQASGGGATLKILRPNYGPGYQRPATEDTDWEEIRRKRRAFDETLQRLKEVLESPIPTQFLAFILLNINRIPEGLREQIRLLLEQEAKISVETESRQVIVCRSDETLEAIPEGTTEILVHGLYLGHNRHGTGQIQRVARQFGHSPFSDQMNSRTSFRSSSGNWNPGFLEQLQQWKQRKTLTVEFFVEQKAKSDLE